MVQFRSLLESTPRYMRATKSSRRRQRRKQGQYNASVLEEGASGLEALLGKAEELCQHRLDESEMSRSTVSEENTSFDAETEDVWGPEPVLSEDDLAEEPILGFGSFSCTEEERTFFAEVLEGLPAEQPVKVWYYLKEWREEDETSVLEDLLEGASGLHELYGEASELSQRSLDDSDSSMASGDSVLSTNVSLSREELRIPASKPQKIEQYKRYMRATQSSSKKRRSKSPMRKGITRFLSCA